MLVFVVCEGGSTVGRGTQCERLTGLPPRFLGNALTFPPKTQLNDEYFRRFLAVCRCQRPGHMAVRSLRAVRKDSLRMLELV